MMKIYIAFLSTFLATSILAGQALADIDSGTCGTGCSWNLSFEMYNLQSLTYPVSTTTSGVGVFGEFTWGCYLTSPKNSRSLTIPALPRVGEGGIWFCV